MAIGKDGAHRALAILRDEFTRTMQLSDARTVADIQADLLFHPPHRQPSATSSPLT